ncbi:MAG: PQQ-binding-like beta-propeller repeat protein [Pirellulaceae bacterium]
MKPVPDGIDQWTHPYHGPDNNPQSNDQLVRGDFRTQFIADPKFSPMPEQTVIVGGRIYKAMGHIAHKANQNEMLNTLLCINAYNGTILWSRPNPPGFMIHRNTMVATDDALYLGDHESCKIIDDLTGTVREQITVPEEITDGPVWKWMAIENGILYGSVGHLEIQVDTQRSERRGLGHWPWGMWKGHDYSDPAKSFGFGRTIVAIDLKTKQPLWHYRDEQFLDSRAFCMKGGRIYVYSPEKFLACINAADGQVVWKNSDKALLDAIAPNEPAQYYTSGYSTSCYMKCNDDYVLFAGPQRSKMVVASARDGKLAWTHPVGNLQLVLRDDAIYAAGPEGTHGVRLEYATGSILDQFPARRACTRATGCVDSVFFRATGGTVRLMTGTNTAQHIAPIRPPCQDGVLISNGHLYWGPWMCGCELSLYGNIGLCPTPTKTTDRATRLVLSYTATWKMCSLQAQPGVIGSCNIAAITGGATSPRFGCRPMSSCNGLPRSPRRKCQPLRSWLAVWCLLRIGRESSRLLIPQAISFGRVTLRGRFTIRPPSLKIGCSSVRRTVKSMLSRRVQVAPYGPIASHPKSV